MKKSVLVMVVAVLAVCGVIGMVVFRSSSAPKPHTVTLTWRPPNSSPRPGTVTYNVYRSTTAGGPYVRIASRLTSPKYDDPLVNGGKTYFYVVTTVDADARESKYSREISAVVP